MGLVTTMVSFYDQQQGAQSAPTSPSHEHMPVGLPESPLAKAVQRPSSASRSRAAMDSTERPSPTSISRQSSLPNVARRQDISAQGHVNSDCLASPGRARSNIEGTNPLDNLATSQAPAEVPSKVQRLGPRWHSPFCTSGRGVPSPPLPWRLHSSMAQRVEGGTSIPRVPEPQSRIPRASRSQSGGTGASSG